MKDPEVHFLEIEKAIFAASFHPRNSLGEEYQGLSKESNKGNIPEADDITNLCPNVPLV